jgi:hypothetical protein
VNEKLLVGRWLMACKSPEKCSQTIGIVDVGRRPIRTHSLPK